MNKKLLLCGAIAAGLLLTACVKKETPKEDEQEQVETTQQTEQLDQPAQAEPLEAVENNETQIPTQVEVERQETANTTTEIHREVRDAPQQKPATEATPKAETAKAEEKPTQAVPSKPTSAAQTEDDAVAAAIAAATPALDK
ncbi:internalin [Acinetobacter sp.]|uniref:internalin n=1 Tax=Acinetobacter sp. TaxID=472 RepID=UPI00264A37D2|nr:internalin [Acinetobacter sp.]MDN5513486.1 internalin [Acinetobacter sp.]MDN5524300.1 internalin [Acinetobacter sp.]